MSAGTVMNAVAADCYMEGTMRTFMDPVFDYLQQGLLRIAERLEEQLGVKIRIEFSSGYPAVLNDPVLTEEVLARYPEMIRPENPK